MHALAMNRGLGLTGRTESVSVLALYTNLRPVNEVHDAIQPDGCLHIGKAASSNETSRRETAG